MESIKVQELRSNTQKETPQGASTTAIGSISGVKNVLGGTMGSYISGGLAARRGIFSGWGWGSTT